MINQHDFVSILLILVGDENITYEYSMKVKKSICYKRVCYIIKNISKEVVIYLVSIFNHNKILYDLIDRRYDIKNSYMFAFSDEGYRFYIEDLRNTYVIESYEFKNKDDLKCRSYNNCTPSKVIEKFDNQFLQYLDLNNCMFTTYSSQFYVKFKTNNSHELLVNCDDYIIDKIMCYCRNYELKTWLKTNKHMKLSWLQFSNESFTVYLR